MNTELIDLTEAEMTVRQVLSPRILGETLLTGNPTVEIRFPLDVSGTALGLRPSKYLGVRGQGRQPRSGGVGG